jgi:hypothetical protein
MRFYYFISAGFERREKYMAKIYKESPGFYR